ncbi:MAG TPA: methyltransferase, partial [Polyangia bacterium]|nr:methyltransferase [Polyangia bacterium]
VRTAPAAAITGADRDARAIESARRNAARAGVDAHVSFSARDVADARPPAGPPGLVIANPPYGRRLGDPRSAQLAYRDLGRVLRAHFRGWRAAIVIPRALAGATSALRLETTARHRLRNGGLPIELAVAAIT